MIIRRSSKEYKGIRKIIQDISGNPAREKLVRLLVVKPGQTINDRIPIEEDGKGADLFYSMNYERILSSFEDKSRKLYQDDAIPNLFYFHSAAYGDWPELPFELDESLMENLEHFASQAAVKKRRQKPEQSNSEIQKQLEEQLKKKNEKEKKRKEKNCSRSCKRSLGLISVLNLQIFKNRFRSILT